MRNHLNAKSAGLIVVLALGAIQFGAAPAVAGKSCGNLNQKTCKVWDRKPACKKGLKKKWGKCVRGTSKKDRMIRAAIRKARQLAPTISSMAIAFSPLGRGRTLMNLKRLSKARRPIDIQRIVERDPRITSTYRLLRQTGHRAMTVGISSGGALVIGGGIETGASLDTYRRRPAYMYQSKAISVGVQAAVGNDIAVSAWTSRNHCVHGRAIGVIVSADLGSGAGAIIWFDARSRRYIGFSAMIGAGSVGGGAAVIKAKTVVYGRRPRC